MNYDYQQPDNLKELKGMGRQFKINIFAVLITLFIMAIGSWLVFDKYVDSFQSNLAKVDSLYTEVGDVRGENNNVYMEIKKTQAELASLHAAIENLDDKLANFEDEDVSQIRIELSSLSEEFSSNEMLKASVQDDGEVVIVYPEDMVNILLVGANGGLTDTIMVASINPDNKSISLISVPRDLYVNGRRINEMYSKYGIGKLKDAMDDILGLKIDEYAVVDLNAFEPIVDALEGLDIYVEKDLYDSLYPTPQKGYKTFSIKAGQYHMDGATALKFARSRKSTSDFDRAKRQQQVIEAMFRKIKELHLYDDKTKAIDMFNIMNQYVHTDIDVFSALAYMKMFKDFSVQRGNVLTSSDYLYSTINVSGAYVLLPRADNYDEIKAYVFEIVAR